MMPTYNRFIEKTVVITGATSGIGAATVRLFALEGANIALVGRNEKKGLEIRHSLLDCKGHMEFYNCDITKPEQVEQLRENILRDFGSIDILFNNAGIFITQDLNQICFDDWDHSFKTNVYGAMYMTKALIKELQKKHGCIINNASVSGLESFTSGTKNYMYGASKAALIKFSKLCALNYAKDVRVNVICPGIVDTEIFINRDFSRFDGMIPMGRIASPEQIARLVLFLASEDADYITGAVIPIDGGMSLK